MNQPKSIPTAADLMQLTFDYGTACYDAAQPQATQATRDKSDHALGRVVSAFNAAGQTPLLWLVLRFGSMRAAEVENPQGYSRSDDCARTIADALNL